MKYTHPDIVNSINARKEGKNTLSWIENFCIYLSQSSCKPRKEGKIENVLVLSIENEERLSIYDCFFEIQPNRTRFCVNKAIPNVCFSKLKALLEEVKWYSKETQEYWNDVLVEKEKTGYNLAKVDESVLQREQTKASRCCPDLSMIDFLSNLGNEIESILQRFGDIKSYHKVYIANGYGNKSFYPLVAPLQYALYKRFKTDSVEPFVKPELFNNQPLASFGWKTHKARFYTGALSRAIGLNVSLELTMNDLMKADGIRVTFPLETGDDGFYTLPATPVLKECSSDNIKDNTKKISLSGVELNWADLYGQVQWDYKVGELAFKQVKLSIYADGCQRLYLMDGDKVLTVISSNGSTVEVENCLKASIAEPATIVEELEVDTSVMATTLDKPKDNPTKVAEGIGGGTKSSTSRADLLILKANLNGKIQSVLTALNGLMRDAAKRYIEKYYPDKTFGLLYDSWINSTRYNGKPYNKKLILDWEGKKQNNETWETDSSLKYLDYTNYYVFIEQQFLNLTKEWNIDNKKLDRMKENINYLKDKIRNLSSHQYVDDFTQEDLISTLTYVSEIIKVLEKDPAEQKKLVGSVIDAQTDALAYYITLKNK